MLDAVFDAGKVAIGEGERPENGGALRTTQRDGASHHGERGIHKYVCPQNDVVEPTGDQSLFGFALEPK